MKLENEFWFDEDAGPLVRPYAVARGRTRPTRHNLEMTTLVVAARTDGDVNVDREYAHILRMCQRPLSIAEVSATLNLPLVVVKVLLSDLIDWGLIIFRSPPRTSEVPQMELLQAVLDGIRKL
ncbi:MAG: DUF742 domain-containing protein [Pseudonocardiales bacterium]|jgi:hypothetical protein|nr:DUF742 domain-containing protein [Pseudonocardiales bacterium]MBV9650887.1 DUF742 domain-containing protein [Pseudonocardiales bacterium]